MQFFSNFSPLQHLLQRQQGKFFLLCDENTYRECYDVFISHCPAQYSPIVIASGEENKDIETCAKIWQALLDAEAGKDALLINLGGGVLSDIGGFAAATYKRGIAFVNVPTTLLAMVDAAYGGKTGVNFKHYKNIVGVIEQPVMVIIHTPFLKTLPTKHLKNGFAEMIKHALLSNTEAVDELLTINHLHVTDNEVLITKSLSIKQNIVEHDPRENGPRKVLNLGHTIGHAIEYAAMKNGYEILHGEAVALGLKVMLQLSVIKMNFDESTAARIINFIDKHYETPVWLSSLHSEMMNAVVQDKKNTNQQIRMVLLKAIGQPEYDVPCTLRELENVLNI